MPEFVLTGDLAAISLASVLQLVEAESLHGELELERGSIEAYNGLLTGARFGALTGATAVLESLIRGQGQFRFRTTTPSSERPIGNTTSLVMESCRLLDEFDRLGPLHLKRAEDWAEKIDDLELRLLVRALDGTAPLAAIVAERDVPVVTSLPFLADQHGAGNLVSAGRSDIVASELLRRQVAARDTGSDAAASGAAIPEAATPAPAPRAEPAPVEADGVPARFDDLIFAARSYARNRRYDLAEQSLLQALVLRPGHRIAAQNLSRIRSLRSTQT